MKLEKYLILNKYLLSLFGAHSISDLREKLKNKKEGFDNEGRSFFVNTLIGLENLRIDPTLTVLVKSQVFNLAKFNNNKHIIFFSLKYCSRIIILISLMTLVVVCLLKKS